MPASIRTTSSHTRSSRTTSSHTDTPATAVVADFDPSTWVEAAPFRACLRHTLGATGLGLSALAVLLELPASELRTLLVGRRGRPCRRIRPETARRLLSATRIHGEDLRRCWPAGEAARGQLRDLLDHGMGLGEIATATRVGTDQLRALLADPGVALPQRSLVVLQGCHERLVAGSTERAEQRLADAA